MEQDNWVYAPNGGIWEQVKDFNFNAMNPEYFPNKQLYITPQLLVDATCGKIDSGYEPYVIYTDKDIDKVMVMVKDAYKSEINSTASAVFTAGGVIVLYINPGTGVLGAILTISGNAATIGGGISLGWSSLEDMRIEDVREAITSGNMHIYYNIYGLKMHNNYSSWNTTGYINKIQVGIPGKISENLTYQQVQEACGLKNYDNN